MKKGSLFPKLFAVAALVLAAAPAFARDHKEIDYGGGILLGIINWVTWEVMHFFNHVGSLMVAASTWNWEYFQVANICADQAFLTSVFFTWYGLLAIGATSVMVGRIAVASARSSRRP